jgi:hypothetical protein
MNQFAKPSRKPVEEPEGLAAFAAAVPGTVVHLQQAAPPVSSLAADLLVDRHEHLGMNVRFTTAEKVVLMKLAEREQRSQHQILKRLLGPVLLEAARDLP